MYDINISQEFLGEQKMADKNTQPVSMAGLCERMLSSRMHHEAVSRSERYVPYGIFNKKREEGEFYGK